jgi:2-polyprenyl-3-methyl-5-hydroxy-6-metoxy-1,4-benzoquinol methylase
MNLDQIGLKYNSDKTSNFHKYLEFYESSLEPMRYTNNNIMEIGILNGDSLKILREYFENSTIYAFDIHDKSYLATDNIKIFTGDQSDRSFLEKTFANEYFDLILDDGSHVMEHQQISIGCLFKKLKPGGIYIIEDLHTSLPDYIETQNYGKDMFGLNENNTNSTIEFLKNIRLSNRNNFYLSDDEYLYLKNNIESIEIKETARRDYNNMSITSVIKKI